MLAYPVKLVAVSGREQPVVLKIRRDGLCLFTEHGKEIQQLPYQHIVKWLPSKMRSRDPGPDDCLDIQVETASGKKDLRMRCQSEPTVQSIIADIRNTVQAIMSDLDPSKQPLSSSPQRPASEHAAAKQMQAEAEAVDLATHAEAEKQQQLEQLYSPSRIPGPPAAASEPHREASPHFASVHMHGQQQHQPQQWQQQYTHPHDDEHFSELENHQQDVHDRFIQSGSAVRIPQQLLEPAGEDAIWQEQAHLLAQAAAGSSPMLFNHIQHSSHQAIPPVSVVAQMLDSRETEWDPLQGVGHYAELVRPGPAGLMRRSTGDLVEFTGGGGEAAVQIQFLEDLVQRLSEELANRVPSDPAAAAAAAAMGVGALGGFSSQLALPPWMKDSRYLNPLLSAYDQRLTAALTELTAKTEAIQDIQDKVEALVAENESLHDRVAKQAMQLEARASDTAAAVAATDTDKARLQERLDLLEQENDLLVSQQGVMDAELARLNRRVLQKEQELAEAHGSVTASTALRAQLEQAVKGSDKATSDNLHLKNKVKNLSERLSAESAKTADAIAAVEALRQQQQVLQQELAAAQATARTVPALQSELSSARSAADSSASELERVRSECQGLRVALHAVEQRLVEYQEKDTEVYLRIKEAMELAEEARLERDAACTETDSLQMQLAATQAKLQEATRQLSGGAADAPSYAQLKKQLAAAAEQLAAAVAREEQLSTQLSELRLTADRVTRDKSTLMSELQAVRDELEITNFIGKGKDLTERLEAAERSRDDAVQKLDSARRAAARAEREWELQRQQMQGDIQRLMRKAAAAEEASCAAQIAATEAQQAVSAVEGELNALKTVRTQAETELRQQLHELRSERDAEVAALVQKLEKALATCDKSVSDAEQMLAAKDSLLRRWKQEAQLIASKLEVALQQHQAELAERQAQVAALTQQLAAAHEQQEVMQQELDDARLSCQEAELLLGEAENRAAVATASAAGQQDDVMQELRMLHLQLERTQLDKLRAERSRDEANAKLGRMMVAGSGVAASNLPAAGIMRNSGGVGGDGGSSVGGTAGFSHAHSTSVQVGPWKATRSSSSASSSSPRLNVGGVGAMNSPRLNPLTLKALGGGLPGSRGSLSPEVHLRVGELQQKDQQYSEH